MTDLELGMNQTLSEPFQWDDSRRYDRGKVLDFEELEKIEQFGRYVDSDGDGIGYRTLPGTHPTKGSFFTRGSSRNEWAVYTEDPQSYIKNMDRLTKKWETIRGLMPIAEIENRNGRAGIIYFGTTTTPMKESLLMLDENGIALNTLRIRSYPFGPEVDEFVESHDKIFLVEQNRDAQMKSLLTLDLGIDPDKVVSILYYGGFSISADYIVDSVMEHYVENKLPRLREVES